MQSAITFLSNRKKRSKNPLNGRQDTELFIPVIHREKLPILSFMIKALAVTGGGNRCYSERCVVSWIIIIEDSSFVSSLLFSFVKKQILH